MDHTLRHRSCEFPLSAICLIHYNIYFQVPLENKSVDIVIFCLSLMGTNFMDYLVEAHRILVVGFVVPYLIDIS